jgi:hypothetical protein
MSVGAERRRSATRWRGLQVPADVPAREADGSEAADGKVRDVQASWWTPAMVRDTTRRFSVA